MRQITDEGIALIKRFEGFSPVPYRDVGGLLTIGYGHLITKGESFTTLSEAEAEMWLRRDVACAERSVLQLVGVTLSDGQFDALVSFTFNLGGGAFQRSTLRRKVNRGDHEEVPAELARWVYVNGSRINGLIRRRRAEAMLYLS